MRTLLLLALSVAFAADPPAGSLVAGASAPAYTISDGKGTATLLLNPTNGSSRAALDALAFQAGATVPLHRHDASDELLYVVSGRIEVTIGGRTLTAGPGDAIHVPQGIDHAAKVLEAAQLVQVYVGPGPEDRFRAAPPAR